VGLGMLLVVAAVLAGSLPVYFCFDAIVRDLYLRRADDWRRCGSPSGYLWRPPGAEEPVFHSARGALLANWIWDTPAWGLEDARFRRHFSRLRWAVPFWTVAVGLAVLLNVFRA
jgi:hypothetical protein